MILVDLAGHMVSDTGLDELHAFAGGMGLKRCWFRVGRRHPHYDLSAEGRIDAIVAGAKLVETRALARIDGERPR